MSREHTAARDHRSVRQRSRNSNASSPPMAETLPNRRAWNAASQTANPRSFASSAKAGARARSARRLACPKTRWSGSSVTSSPSVARSRRTHSRNGLHAHADRSRADGCRRCGAAQCRQRASRWRSSHWSGSRSWRSPARACCTVRGSLPRRKVHRPQRSRAGHPIRSRRRAPLSSRRPRRLTRPPRRIRSPRRPLPPPRRARLCSRRACRRCLALRQ